MNYKISGAGNSWQVTLGKRVVAEVQSKQDAMSLIDTMLDTLSTNPIQVISLQGMKDELDRVYMEAWAAVTKPAQQNALLKAQAFLLGAPDISFHMLKGLAFVPSAHDEGTVYIAGKKTCTCKAHEGGKLCWHRMAARIIQKVVTGE